MGQKFTLERQAGVLPLSDDFTGMGTVPANDDGGEWIEAGHAVALARQVSANTPKGSVRCTKYELSNPEMSVLACGIR